MKPQLIFYRLITFILLPIAAINAISILGILPAAFANPLMLISVFINFAVIMYTFTSFSFFIRGVVKGKPFKASFKDWIKVNAYVSIGYGSIILLCALIYFGSADIQKKIADNSAQLQTVLGAKNLDKAALLRLLRGGLSFAACFSAVLIAHIIITLGLLKKYKQLFVEGKQPI